MTSPIPNPLPEVAGKILLISGRFPRVARIRAEDYDLLDDPTDFIEAVRKSGLADIFSFIQPVTDLVPRHPYRLGWQSLSVLKFDSFDSWWKNQLNDKTRNMIRKAAKKGIEVRLRECDDEFVEGIKEIYDESPLRQGKPFRHYGKDLATLKAAHHTFLERSEFLGAYFEGKLIGFIKMIYHEKSVSLMQIIAMYQHRDKAPTNALLAKAVEICSSKGIHCIQYGLWSRRGFGEFKKHHCFEHVRVPRFYVPLNFHGRIALLLQLHRNFLDLLPDSWLDFMANLRGRWYARKSATGVG